MIGRTLNHYKVVGHLGQGGVGEVLAAMQRVEIYAWQGGTDDALTALRRAIKAGWRAGWYLKLDPALEPLEGHPRLRAMLAEVRADVARMRQHLAAEGPADRPL